MSSNRRKKIAFKEQNVSLPEEEEGEKKLELSLSFFLLFSFFLQHSLSCSVFVNSRCPSSSTLPMIYLLSK